MKNVFKTTPAMIKANPVETGVVVGVTLLTAGTPFAVWGVTKLVKKIIATVKAKKDNVEVVEEVI